MYPELMGRHRPALDGWDERPLAELDSTDPREWVLTLLTDGRQVSPDVRGWTYGEIREAIRRAIAPKKGWGPGALNLASSRAQRGLAALKSEGLIVRRRNRYSVPYTVRMTEWTIQMLRMGVKKGLRVHVEIGPSRNPWVSEFASSSRRPFPIRFELVKAGSETRRGARESLEARPLTKA